MKNYFKLIVSIIVVALLVIFGVYFYKGDNASNSTLKIGVFTPLTGEAAAYGEAMKNGLDLAASDINKNGGILGKKVELVYEDTRLDPKLSTAAMNKFISVDKMQIVIAAEGSGATLAALPLADQNKVLTMVGIASTPEIKNAGDFVFRVVPSDDYQGNEMAKLAKDKNYKKAAILYVNDAYGVGIKDVFSNQFNGENNNIVDTEQFETGVKDFRTQLLKIKSNNPDLIIIVARKEYPAILKQIKELSINTKIITSETFKDDDLLKASGKNAEGVFVTYFAPNTDYVNFKEKYKQAYKAEPAVFSDFGYDALMVIAQAAKQSGKIDSVSLKNALYNLEYKGATGIVKFDSNGEVINKPYTFYKVENGKFVESQ